MLLQVVVTTCCGQDIRWLGKLFSSGDHTLKIPQYLGEDVTLLI